MFNTSYSSPVKSKEEPIDDSRTFSTCFICCITIHESCSIIFPSVSILLQCLKRNHLSALRRIHNSCALWRSLHHCAGMHYCAHASCISSSQTSLLNIHTDNTYLTQSDTHVPIDPNKTCTVPGTSALLNSGTGPRLACQRLTTAAWFGQTRGKRHMSWEFFGHIHKVRTIASHDAGSSVFRVSSETHQGNMYRYDFPNYRSVPCAFSNFRIQKLEKIPLLQSDRIIIGICRMLLGCEKKSTSLLTWFISSLMFPGNYMTDHFRLCAPHRLRLGRPHLAMAYAWALAHLPVMTLKTTIHVV